MNQRPLILISNDDGYEAKGLQALVEVAKELGEVVVVAPDTPRSACSHAITMNIPLRIHLYRTDPDGTRYFRSNGTPSDCVKLGLKVILKERKVDLIAAGINHGSNSSVSVLYSGTMGAAMEGSVENYKAVGFSLLDYSPDANFSAAQVYVKKIMKKVLTTRLPDRIALNVNIPKAPIEAINGIKITRQALGFWHEEMDERTDPYGGKYYWLTGWLDNDDLAEDTCEWALQHNYVSIQPVHHDLTAHRHIHDIKFLEE